MGKRLILVLALALVVGLTFSSAYAEVQNVKVSGDILASGVMRENFNLAYNADPANAVKLRNNFFMTQTRVRIDADLTDNVMATVRLINERMWNGQYDTVSSGNDTINLDLAYVTLKEFLYSPLTLTVGRQEIKFGNGLIIGNAKVASGVVSIPTDLTERKAFDAIRATLNYDPLVVDVIYAKVRQSSIINANTRNDINLYGINATYALNKKNDISAYYFNKNNNATDHGEADEVNTIGALLSSSPIENLTASLEGAYQFGKDRSSSTRYKKHSAWALQAMADYTFAKIKMTPKIGASYTYLSGSEGTAYNNTGWDPMFYDQKLNSIVYALHPFTNMSAFNLRASAKPVEDITVSLNYGYYDLAKKFSGTWTLGNTSRYDGTTQYLPSVTLTGKQHIGDEIDATVIYDYTEDVQFGLTAGWLKTGKAININRENATQLIGSMKVTF